MSNLQVWFDQKYTPFIGDTLQTDTLGVSGVTAYSIPTPFGPYNMVNANRTTTLDPTGLTANPTVTGDGNSALQPAFSFDVSGAWNSVKNAMAISSSAETLEFKDFVHVDISVGDSRTVNGSLFASSAINIENAKRAHVETGSGADFVKITTLTNFVSYDGNGKSNSWYDISLGKGSDELIFGEGSAYHANDGATGPLTVVESGGNRYTTATGNGSLSWAHIDLGNDSDEDTIRFNGVTFDGGKGAANFGAEIDNYGAGDRVFVDGVEVTFTGTTGDGIYSWIHLI